MSSHIVSNYIFNSAAKTVTLSDYASISLAGIKLITNVTTGTIIYQFNDGTKNGSVSGNTLTLDFDTTLMSNTDALMVIYEEPTVYSDTQGILSLLGRLWALIKAPPWTTHITAGQAVRIVSDTSSTLNSCGTVTNVTNVQTMQALDSRNLLWNQWAAEYRFGLRSKIQ